MICKHKTNKYAFSILLLFIFTLAKAEKMTLPDDPFISNLKCGNNKITLEANTRSTDIATIYINDINTNAKKKTFKLSKNICYGRLKCIKNNGIDAIGLISDEACGGNAVEPTYIIINTLNFQRTNYDAISGRKNGLEKIMFAD